MPSAKRVRSPDRSKIKLQDAAQARYWARHLGISVEELAALVDKVGNSPAAVRAELAGKQHR
jgi:uncharacterized protein DUF3606